MANTTERLNISELDFQNIKDNLKAFIGSQEQFTGYDFSGSAFDILFDILSYNTYYNAFYMNMLSNEAFLDTATTRDAVVSKAKAIGYTPRSPQAARAIVSLAIDTGNATPSSVLIDKYTSFTAVVGTTPYNFLTTNAYTVFPDDNGVYAITDVKLAQGQVFSQQFTVDTANTDQRFVLLNNQVDTTLLEVYVKTSNLSSNVHTYTRSNDITTLSPTSNVYFLQETSNGHFEVLFGDNAFGRKLQDFNVVTIVSIITEGADANGARSFSSIGGVGGYNAIVTSTQTAYGGGDRETIEKIKYNAPKYYETQNRLVTANDYKVWLLSQYADADSITTWGGEDNDPPVYGKVFIAVKPKYGLYLTEQAKLEIINDYLKPKNIVSVTPEIVAPDYIYLKLNSRVIFDLKATNLSASELRSKIITDVLNFNSTTLALFDRTFRFSEYLRVIDNSDRAIISNDTRLTVAKKIDIFTNAIVNYDIDFGNRIFHPTEEYNGTLSSSFFSYIDTDGINYSNCTLYDKAGLVYVRDAQTELVLNTPSVGTINYLTGKIQLSGFNPYALSTEQLELIVRTDSNDVSAQRQQIILITEENLTINMIQELF